MTRPAPPSTTAPVAPAIARTPTREKIRYGRIKHFRDSEGQTAEEKAQQTEKLAKAEVIGPRQWPKLQALITRADGKPSVAPESDKRPAICVKPVADDFDVVEESVEDLV